MSRRPTPRAGRWPRWTRVVDGLAQTRVAPDAGIRRTRGGGTLRQFHIAAQSVAVGLVRRGDQAIDPGDPLLLDAALEALTEGRLVGCVAAAGRLEHGVLEVFVGDELIEVSG